MFNIITLSAILKNLKLLHKFKSQLVVNQVKIIAWHDRLQLGPSKTKQLANSKAFI